MASRLSGREELPRGAAVAVKSSKSCPWMGQLRCGRDSGGAGERKKLEHSRRVPIPPRWRAPAGQDSEHQVGVKRQPHSRLWNPKHLRNHLLALSRHRLGPAQYKLDPLGSSPVQTGSYSPKHRSMGVQGVLVWVGIRQPVRITELDWMIHVDPIQPKSFCDISMAPGLISCHSINDRSEAGHSWAHPCPRMAPS